MRFGSNRSHARLLALLATALLPLAACGSDGPSTADTSTTNDPAAAKDPAAGNGDSWADYMVLRDGYTCTASAKVSGTQSTAKIVTTDVSREDGLVRFTITTSTSVKGSGTAPTKIDIRYEEQPDGTLRASFPAPTIPGFTTTTDGSMTMPSPAMLRSGKTTRSKVRMTLVPDDPATREQILGALKDGAKGMDITLTTELGPAPRVDKITTDDGTFTDLLGVKTEPIDAAISNAKDATLEQSFGQMLDAFKQGTSEAYWARGHGQVRTVGFGVPVTVSGCTG